jgi:hypothetical protein
MRLLAGLACAALACLPGRASALDMRDLTLISPITGISFRVVGVPGTQRGGDTLADMGADDDGCRHSSGASEYDYYIATDPSSYFSALTEEWDDRTGRFRGTISPEFKEWVQREFNGDLQVDINHGFQLAIATNKAKGLPPPERSTFQLGQGDLAIEKRYRYALSCYAKRGARPAVLAKMALMGAWAIRSRVNLAIANQSLAGGYEEVNDKVVRQIKDGESFSLAKFLPIYQDIFENSRLSNEAYLVAGLVYFGMELREGDLGICQGILKKLTERLKEAKNGDVMRGLVRERQAKLKEYLFFLDQSARNFMEAIEGEEFTRQHLPETMLVVAECLRRGGEVPRAMDWYLAVAKMAETQPKWRDEFRAQGKAPGPDAPYHVQLGWIADRHIAELTKAGPVVHADVDKPLLNAVVFENLGSTEYQNPRWKPATGATQRDCAVLLDIIGKATLEFSFRENLWPKSLGELWERDFIHDRNYVNRFHCPVTGKPFLYQEPTGDLSHIPPKSVLIATPEPVPTAQGPRYAAYLANTTIVWSATPLKPGEIFNQ